MSLNPYRQPSLRDKQEAQALTNAELAKKVEELKEDTKKKKNKVEVKKLGSKKK